MAQVHTCAHDVRHYAALMGARHGPYGGSILAICGCNLGCRRRRRPSGLSLVAIPCIVVRMMTNSRRHHRQKAYAPTRSGIIINRAVSASLAALRAMPPGSRPMLRFTKSGLQPAAAPGCGRSRALLRRCADAPRDREAPLRSPSVRDGRFSARGALAARSWRAIRARNMRAHRPRS